MLTTNQGLGSLSRMYSDPWRRLAVFKTIATFLLFFQATDPSTFEGKWISSWAVMLIEESEVKEKTTGPTQDFSNWVAKISNWGSERKLNVKGFSLEQKVLIFLVQICLVSLCTGRSMSEKFNSDGIEGYEWHFFISVLFYPFKIEPSKILACFVLESLCQRKED